VSVEARFVPKIKGGAQLTWESTMEIEGKTKPVLVAETVSRLYT